MNWNYITGFFDADGSIQLNKIHRNQMRSPVLTFHNNEINILEAIRKFINDKLNIKGTIIRKKARCKNHQDQYELRYSYFPKVLAIRNELTSLHPKKNKRFEVIRELSKLSKRNGKYTQSDLDEIDKLLTSKWA